MLKSQVIFLMGPTASGKTALATALYQQFPIELISVDSALVYRDMNIGTAKPDAETLARAPHHLIDIIQPLQSYSAAQFRQDAMQLIKEIHARGKVPVLVGGTMLYFSALQAGLSDLPKANASIRAQLDAEAAALGWPAMHAKLAEVDAETAMRLHPSDTQRIQRALEVYATTGQPMSALLRLREYGEDKAQASFPFPLLKIALTPSDRAVLHARIAQRFDDMLSQGLIDEVKQLLLQYPDLHLNMPALRCVGYRQAFEYLRGDGDIASMREKGIAATRQLAKRQLTWLRGMQDTINIDCLAEDVYTQVAHAVQGFLA